MTEKPSGNSNVRIRVPWDGLVCPQTCGMAVVLAHDAEIAGEFGLGGRSLQALEVL